MQASFAEFLCHKIFLSYSYNFFFFLNILKSKLEKRSSYPNAIKIKVNESIYTLYRYKRLSSYK